MIQRFDQFAGCGPMFVGRNSTKARSEGTMRVRDGFCEQLTPGGPSVRSRRRGCRDAQLKLLALATVVAAGVAFCHLTHAGTNQRVVHRAPSPTKSETGHDAVLRPSGQIDIDIVMAPDLSLKAACVNAVVAQGVRDNSEPAFVLAHVPLGLMSADDVNVQRKSGSLVLLDPDQLGGGDYLIIPKDDASHSYKATVTACSDLSRGEIEGIGIAVNALGRRVLHIRWPKEDPLTITGSRRVGSGPSPQSRHRVLVAPFEKYRVRVVNAVIVDTRPPTNVRHDQHEVGFRHDEVFVSGQDPMISVHLESRSTTGSRALYLLVFVAMVFTGLMLPEGPQTLIENRPGLVASVSLLASSAIQLILWFAAEHFLSPRWLSLFDPIAWSASLGLAVLFLRAWRQLQRNRSRLEGRSRR